MIHSSACIHPQAKIGKGVSIEPFANIGMATIGNHTTIRSGAVIKDQVSIGEYNDIGEYSIIGGNPQDISFNTTLSSGVSIGNHNAIREYVTIHRATRQNETTIIGDYNLLMTSCHVAHDVRIHNHVVIVNTAQLAGFVEIMDYAFLSAMCNVHQFVRIGENAMIAALSKVTRDIPPFSLAEGQPAKYYGLNVVGLRRLSFNSNTRNEIKEIYDCFYKTDSLQKNLELIRNLKLTPIQQKILDFLQAKSSRGFVIHKRRKEKE